MKKAILLIALSLVGFGVYFFAFPQLPLTKKVDFFTGNANDSILYDKAKQGVWIISSDGKDDRQLLPKTADAFGGAFSWSPDGTKVALTALGKLIAPLGPFATDLYIYDFSTQQMQKVPTENNDGIIADFTDTEYPASWSSNGKSFTYIQAKPYPSTQGSIVVVDANDFADQTKIINSVKEFASNMRWSPYGESILFVENDDTIIIIDSDGANKREYTRDHLGLRPTQVSKFQLGMNAFWGRDKKEVIVAESWGFGAKNPRLYAIDLEAIGSPQLLIKNDDYKYAGYGDMVSPHSSYIFLQPHRDQSHSNKLSFYSLNDRAVVDVVLPVEAPQFPNLSWSPDGTQFAVYSTISSDVPVVTIDGIQSFIIQDASNVSWSP